MKDYLNFAWKLAVLFFLALMIHQCTANTFVAVAYR